VIEAVRRFGWHPLPDPPRGEDDVFELWMLRDLARDLGAVRRSDGGWWPRAPAGPWPASRGAVVCGRARLGGGHDFAAMVTVLAPLLGETGEVTEATLVEEVDAGAVGEGWHELASSRCRTADCLQPAGRAAMAAGDARPAPR
jgi:hypothetical protein